ncbi:MAG: GNAT family N-acetyltransferase [Candidatus Devosia symbiotica]|nr:GNAT family N-acetyltransferase [Candidatus Devosia symbiotica]
MILGDRHFIGVIDLHLLPEQAPELGYWLGEPHWNQGFGSEAAIAVVAAAGVTELRSRALSSNARSRKVLAKAGFAEIGNGPDTGGTNAGKPTTFMQLAFNQ